MYKLHMLSVLVFLVGVVLFVVWASRLKAKELKKLVCWLLVLGLVGGLVTMKAKMKDGHMMKKDHMKMGEMMKGEY